MPIETTDLRLFESVVVLDGPTNGGGMSAIEKTDGLLNDIWEDVTSSQKTLGHTLHKKLFAKVHQDGNGSFLDSTLFNDAPTTGDDYMVLFPGTFTDTEADFDDTRIYGTSALNTDTSIGGQTLIVTVEHADLTGIFQAGDKIHITNMLTPDAVTGYEEFHTISEVVSVVDTTVTITIVDVLSFGFLSADSKVSSVYEYGTVTSYIDTPDVTSTSGTFDELEVLTNNMGTVEETITITFTDATNFSAVGSISGSIGSGTTGTDFIPNNADFTKAYFTIYLEAWGGTWATNDTVVFDSHAAAIPFWLRRIVPALASSLSGNSNTTVFDGEAA